MPLEVIKALPDDHSARQTRSTPPLLFVHGAYVAAWCWAEYFLPYFAQQGYACYALSLRGHGASDCHSDLASHSISDYVADVNHVIDSLSQTPVLIGHSMGGFVIQHIIAQGHIPASVLLASVPPQGLLPMTTWLSATQPWLLSTVALAQWGQTGLADFQTLRDTWFSAELDDELARCFIRQARPESQRALLDMSGFDLALQWPSWSAQKALVLGAEHDSLLPQYAVHATAMQMGVQARFLANTGHVMMLDAAWQETADCIIAWLQEQNL